MTAGDDFKVYLRTALLRDANAKCDEAGIPHLDWCPVCGAGDLGIDYLEHLCPTDSTEGTNT